MTIDHVAQTEGRAIAILKSFQPIKPKTHRKSRIKYGKKPEKVIRATGLCLAPPEAPQVPDFMREILARYTRTPFSR